MKQAQFKILQVDDKQYIYMYIYIDETSYLSKQRGSKPSNQIIPVHK